jgi:large subunit ribosomal protein L10
MAKTREKKESEVKNLAENFAAAKSVVLTSCDGLKVSQSQELRNLLRAKNVNFVACKKTLVKRAASDVSLEIAEEMGNTPGSLALAFGEDEVSAAKILAEFVKGKDTIKIHGGILEGKFINTAKVLELSKLPSKLEMIAITLRTMQAPVSGFVNVLAGNLRGLVNVLNAVKEAKS